jgi:hypothetical protein
MMRAPLTRFDKIVLTAISTFMFLVLSVVYWVY